MKSLFFFGIGLMAIVAVAGYMGWRLILSFYDVYDDYRAGQESKQLRAERSQVKEQMRLQNEERLNNDCEHVFDNMYGAFPADVCCKCGLEKAKPLGSCDHVWRKIDGPTPSSRCEKCGKQHGGARGD